MTFLSKIEWSSEWEKQSQTLCAEEHARVFGGSARTGKADGARLSLGCRRCARAIERVLAQIQEMLEEMLAQRVLAQIRGRLRNRRRCLPSARTWTSPHLARRYRGSGSDAKRTSHF